MLAGSVASTDPTAAVLLGGLWAIWIVGEVAISVRSLFRRGAKIRDRGSFFVVLGSVFAGFFLGSALASALPGAAITDGRYAVFFAGLVIMAGGIALRFTAVAVLGRFFTVVVMVGSDQHVVDTGPYRWIRHPSYTGSLLTIAGFLLCATNRAALVGIVPVLVGMLYRIRVEERALSAELGDAYRSYAARTKGLVPFVY
jgi:protein-S-isoprenylcysteine O-methyltransferase Ste14